MSFLCDFIFEKYHCPVCTVQLDMHFIDSACRSVISPAVFYIIMNHCVWDDNIVLFSKRNCSRRIVEQKINASVVPVEFVLVCFPVFAVAFQSFIN